jgi:hypothetical protein
MIEMGIEQLQRSALRRALQSCFFESILAILGKASRRGKLATRYEASWKWTLTLCSLLQQGVSENSKIELIKMETVRLGIHPNNASSHSHQLLFNTPGINSMPNNAVAEGIMKLSNQSLLEKMDKKHRKEIEKPWNYILPEDIGSCFEIIREIKAVEGKNSIELVYADERRNSGVHFTPFDVTRHMVDLSLEKIEISDDSIPEDLVICDLAVGAGAFLLQFARIISNMTGVNVGVILEKHVIGFDIDPNVLQISSLCFHLERGCPNVETAYQLHKIDSIGQLNSREKIKTRIAEMMPSSKGNPTITTGNPPYVRVKSKEYSHLGFQSNKCGNLSAYFVEQAIEITEIGKVICQIVPQSIIQSKRMNSIRKILHTRCSSIDIEAYGCVPGYMFDQGKIGSNSSTSITQRVAIITAVTGEAKTPILTSTRFIRWGSKERNILFDDLQKTRIPNQLCADYDFPMIGEENAKKVLFRTKASNRKLSDILCSNNRLKLYVPKAVRYFCTAARNDLHRSQIELNFLDISSRNMAQILINSSFFYWHWRIFGNGFQVSNRDLQRLPVPSVETQEMYQKEINSMGNRLHRKRKSLAVKKSNKGMIENIKYDNDPKLMYDLDKLIRTLFELESDYPFHASKENSLQGYQSHFQLS